MSESSVIISCCTSLKRLGIFHDYKADPETESFRRYNLIYGFNGSGKTTLTRVFASLEDGEICSGFPEGGNFEIRLSNGNSIKSDGPLDAIKGRVLVFNSDYVEQNILWREGTANPVFYLGEKQAGIAEELAKKEAELQTVQNRHIEATESQKSRKKALDNYQRDTARLIAEALNLGRSYNATHLRSDYSKQTYDTENSLEKEEREVLKTTINQTAPLDKLSSLVSDTAPIAQVIAEARTLLVSTLGTATVEGLKDHPSMTKWIKEGLEYHDAQTLAECLFCGNDLSDERRKALAVAIDERYEQLASDVISLQERTKQQIAALSELRDEIPSKNDLTQDRRENFEKAEADLRERIETADSAFDTISSLLERKEKAPNLAVDASNLVTNAEMTTWAKAFDKSISEVNAAIADHNKSHDDFAQVQKNAKSKLKRHFLAESQEEYAKLVTELDDAHNALTKLEDDRDSLQKEIDSMRQQLREHGVAANKINGLIRSYLGHNELEFGAVEEGYELRRKGEPVDGPLSEGEKTAVALCYFIATLEAEGRKRKDLILVIDDPISSLDTKALNYAFNLIKAAVTDAAQVILLTHNLHFMNEAKKWLRNEAKEKKNPSDKEPTASLLIVDARRSVDEDKRYSSIRKMPKHIREYDSEYQYLFHLLLRFLETGDGVDYFYVMPNALRKLLEIFLAFKAPNIAKLEDQIKAVKQENNFDLDQSRLMALERLVQLESHGDNLDDLISFSSLTVEETKDAAGALLDLMEATDKPHLDGMRKFCKV